VAATSAAGLVTVTWKAPTNTGGGSITNYTATVWSALTGGVSKATCASTAVAPATPALRCTLTSVLPAGTYYVDVTATNTGALTSPPSTPRVSVKV
jgi:hypothetical protein